MVKGVSKVSCKKFKSLNLIFFIFFAIIFSAFVVSAAPILDNLHLNIQTVDGSGNVVTGTFNFVFNISTNVGCTAIVYSNSTTLATDSRGIISYYLQNTNLNYDNQYYLCYYRDGSLIETSKIARTPYSFTALNTTVSGLIVDSNLNLGGYNATASWFNGLFNWTTADLYTTFNGYSLSFNESKLNQTIQSFGYSSSVDLSSIGNWSADMGNYYNITQIENNFTNYYTQTQILNFGYYNSTTLTSNFQLLNGNNYWNNTFATFNKTYADTLYNPFGISNSTAWNVSGTYVFLANTLNNVGIGTALPNYKLDVAGTVNTYNLLINGTPLSGTGNITGAGTSGHLPLFNSGSNIGDSVIYQNGTNVGIGTTNPTTKLEVNGTVTSTEFAGGGSGITGITGSQITNDLNWLNSTSAGVLYYGINNPSGFYNSTDFSISDYLLITNWNTTNSSYLTSETNWNANYSTFLTHATTNYVDAQNTSIVNWVGSLSLTDFTNNLNIGNWTLDKPNYYNSTQVDNAISTGSSNNSNLLDGYDSNFFMPLNTSVYGQFDYNGGWTANGLSIIDGNLYAQQGFFYQINSLSVSTLEMNGSIIPDLDNQFDLGNSTRGWRNLYVGTNIYEGGTALSSKYYGINNPSEYYNSTTLTSNSQLLNGNNYWNDTFATFNKTYGDTLYYGINNPLGYYNSTTLSGIVSGSGTYGYIPMWNGTTSINNSAIYQNGSNLGINTTTPQNALNVVGDINSTGLIYGNGSQLTGISTTESDPKWTANYSIFLTHATTNYVDAQNTSQINWVNSQGFLTSYSETDPKWTANYSIFLTHATTNYVDAQNTSQINWVNSQGFLTSYSETDPQVGAVSSGFWCRGSGSAVECDVTAITNNNQLTNGAGYITDGNTGWDNSYGYITWGTAANGTLYLSSNPSGYITDGNTGWDNSYGFITDGNTGWDNSYGYITWGTAANGTLYLSSNPSGYTSNTGTVTSVATTAPITGGTIVGAGTIGITQATTSTNGYLSSTDWNTFNNKLGSYTETDPQVGAVTSGYWCRGSGSTVECDVTAITNNNQLTNGAGYINWGTAANGTLYLSSNPAGYITSSGTAAYATNAYACNADSTCEVGALALGNGVYISEGGTNVIDVDYGGTNTYFKVLRSLLVSGDVGIRNNAPAYTLDVTGTGRFTSTLYAQSFIYTSDERLKKNITNLDVKTSLDKIKELRGVSFEWRNSSENNGTHLGFIAQDVEKIFPEVVQTNAEGYKAVEYGNLVAPLVGAVQELNNQTDLIKEFNKRISVSLSELNLSVANLTTQTFEVKNDVLELKFENTELKKKNEELSGRIDKLSITLENICSNKPELCK